MTKYLNTFKPAEIHLLLENGKAGLGNLLKFTFMDLLRRGVLAFGEYERASDQNGTVRQYRYVMAGAAFNTYTPLVYEDVFLKHFRKDPDRRILFRSLVKLAAEAAVYKNRFIMLIIRSSTQRQLYAGFRPAGFPGRGRLSEAGKKLRSELEAEIAEAEQKLGDVSEATRSNGLEYLLALGAGILFVQNWEHTREYWTAGLRNFEPAASTGDWSSTGSDWSFYGEESWDTSADNGSWDAACSGADSSDSSGCSGCSGCGGCGGD